VIPPQPIDQIAEALLGLKPRHRLGNYGRVVNILARPLRDAEDLAVALGAAFSLLDSKAPLFALQAIARRFGLALPPGFEKKDYRIFIRAQAAAVLSSGSWPQVQRVADLLRQDNVSNRSLVHRLPPDHLRVEVPGLPLSYYPVARQIVRQAIRAQDSFDLVTIDPTYFTFDTGPGFDLGILAP
jgi:hypothetical protein